MAESEFAGATDGRSEYVEPGAGFGNSVFVSYPKPYTRAQMAFIRGLSASLKGRGFFPRTLGVTDYDTDAPLRAVRRLMFESHGLIAVAFKRIFVESGTGNFRADLSKIEEFPLRGVWLSTPWVHIEPAMAYQLGLPTLIVREKGVLADGILEKGVTGLYAPEFDVDGDPTAYLKSTEWNQILTRWEYQVRTVIDRKGSPPRLYD
ncbi:hypothetical protein QRX60_19905 [Amycolatopsis mongoliensis]|uniref:Uncharacterized protein n=1 Tax=Amycolatopsis mongoliensis TaxID=715475 RepID=A0A9Y2JYJ9_9PSEU|nr:hypothetical protein [Amycolatopsis sp. 4-36]WIY05991.1 hypothetical protein QRX60_19905 [Amycolatopsis sp. 4-36]